jgi:hypothetical protein
LLLYILFNKILNNICDKGANLAYPNRGGWRELNPLYSPLERSWNDSSNREEELE